jgi:hypothetical protein
MVACLLWVEHFFLFGYILIQRLFVGVVGQITSGWYWKQQFNFQHGQEVGSSVQTLYTM